VEMRNLTAERLAQLIQRVRQNPSYRDKARYFQKVIARTQGLAVISHSLAEGE
jgi:zeaxanthin glucosyltransferase